MGRRIALVLCSLVIAAVAMELALRAFLPRLPIGMLMYMNAALKDRAPRSWVRVRDFVPTLNIRQEDPDTGWNHKPNLRSTGRNEDGEPYDRTTSPEGFFTPDVPTPSTPQLVMLGDSFASTFYVRQPIAWVLRDAIRTPVYNLAVGGWGPESYRAAYDKYAARRRHTLVVVLTFVNDISDVDNWLAWKSQSPNESFLTWIQRTAEQSGAVNRGTSWPDTNLAIWNVLKFTLSRSRPALSQPLQATSVPVLSADAAKLERFEGVDGAFSLQLARDAVFLQHGAGFFEPGSSYYPYLQAYFESLVRLKSDIERSGARMVLVWVPAKERVYVPLLPVERRSRYVSDRTADVGGLERILGEFADSEGLSFFDLTPTLSERARAGEKLYFTVDGHLNSRGNVVAGEAMAHFTETLPSVPRPRSQRPLFVRHGVPTIEQALSAASLTFRAAIVSPSATAFVVKGRAESRFGYVAQWPDMEIAAPKWLIARGVVHAGGITIGLLRSRSWAVQTNVTRTGPFELALPVAQAGRYQPLIANNLSSSLDTDVEISGIGWGTPQ